MIFPEKDFLSLFGWDDVYLTKEQESSEDLLPARVIGEEKNLYRLQVGLEKTKLAIISGRMRHESFDRLDLPAVGDWVLCSYTESDDRALIHQVLPRKSILQRRQVDTGGQSQIIATNIDYLFVAMSLNDDFNVNRLDRYLTLGWDSGAQPVIVLTKSDLSEDVESAVRELELQNPAVPVCAISSLQETSLQILQTYLQRGKTAVVVGSSGVGKSTLINNLIGHEMLKTQSIREEDARGRHTTTSRYLFHTHFGGLIIDTPGMREIQMLDHEQGLQKQFEDIEALVMGCRFSDCQHLTEPGCRVLESLEAGQLTQGRWASYLKLLKEIHHMKRKSDKALLSEDRKLWKKRIARRVVSNRSGE